MTAGAWELTPDVLEEAVLHTSAEQRAHHLQLEPLQEAEGLLPPVELWVRGGRVLGARAELGPEESFLRLGLGPCLMTVNPAPELDFEPINAAPALSEVFEQVRAETARLGRSLAQLGGLGARLYPAKQVPKTPEAEWLAEAASSGATVAGLLGPTPDVRWAMDELLRLYQGGVLAPRPAALPRPARPEVPMVAEVVSPPVGPNPAPEPLDEIDYVSAGGDGQRLLIVGLVLLVAVLIGLLLSRDLEEPPPPPPPPPVLPPPPPPPPPVVTATPTPPAPPPPPPPRRARSSYSLSRPPPIAGPEADARLRSAERLMNRGQYDEAAKMLEQLRRSLPRDPTVWVLSGHLEAERSRFPDSLRFLDQALRLDADNYRALVLKGSVEQFSGARDAARATYRRALEVGPDHAMSRELRKVLESMERSPAR